MLSTSNLTQVKSIFNKLSDIDEFEIINGDSKFNAFSKELNLINKVQKYYFKKGFSENGKQ